MKTIIAIGAATFLILMAGWLIWSEMGSDDQKKTTKRQVQQSLVAKSAKANKLELEFADNKEGRELKKLVKKDNNLTWRCLSVSTSENKGFQVHRTGLTLGTGIWPEDKDSVVLEDQARKLPTPAVVCNVQIAGRVYDLAPLDGVKADARLVDILRQVSVELFKAGYSALSPKLGQDINSADVNKLSVDEQVKLMQKFQSNGLICVVNNKPTQYKVIKLPNAKKVPGPCQIGVAKRNGRSVWIMHGAEKDKVIFVHEF